MEDLNNVPSSGTYGAAINEVNANFSLVVNAINSLEYATTKSKGIYNNGFTPNTTTLPNSVSGDWCMVLGTGNTFPATIWTFNGTTWTQGGQWSPDGIDLTGYATTTALNTAVANSLLQATARMGYGEATASNNAYSVTIANYTLPINGGVVRVKMPTAATGAATLNITNTGAKTILYNGAAVSSANTWEQGEIISVFYDGTNYQASNNQGGGGKMDDVPTAGSGKAAKSGGIYASTAGIKNGDNGSDLDIEDEARNILARFANGHFQTKYFDSSQLPELATKNNENFDFTIEDEAGDAIALFQRGHIRTKNFNSETFSAANYLKDKFQGKKIAIIGDSISTYQGWLPSDVSGFSGTAYATYYPHGDVDSVSKTWWYQMALNLGINTSDIANTSWSGGTACGDSTSTTYGKPACSTKRINDIAIRGFVPDIILVSVGGNDWGQCGLSGYSTTPGTWKESDPIPSEGTIYGFRNAYALILAKIQQTYPLARVFCCTMLDDYRRDGAQDDASDNVWPPNNQYKGDYVAFSTSKNYLIGDKVSYSGSYYEFVNNHFAGAWNANDVNQVTPKGITICEWNNHIREIANAFGCDVIDMHKCGITYFNIPSLAVDGGLHPNAAGHALMARKATSELMAKY